MSNTLPFQIANANRRHDFAIAVTLIKLTIGLLASAVWTGRISMLWLLAMGWCWTARDIVVVDALSMKLRERWQR